MHDQRNIDNFYSLDNLAIHKYFASIDHLKAHKGVFDGLEILDEDQFIYYLQEIDNTLQFLLQVHFV